MGRKHVRFSFRFLLALVAAAAIVCLLLTTIRSALQPKVRTTRTTALSIPGQGLGLGGFSNTLIWLILQQRRPVPVPASACTPPVSWRVLMTELMFYPEPPYNYRRPWNHRLNQEYDNRFYHLYCVDADGYREWDRHFTNIVAVTGPGTAWRDGRTTIDHGKLGSDTVLLVEVAPSLGIEWMEPRDLDIRTMPREIGHPQGICANFPFLGAMIGFADGEVWTLRNDTPFCALAPFLTVEGAHLHDREELLGPYVVHRQPPGFRIPFP